MLLQVFLLGLIPAYASDFLTLVVDASRIPESGDFTCVQHGSTLWNIPLRVAGEVPGYRGASDCDIGDFRFDGVPPTFNRLFASYNGFLVYVCNTYYASTGLSDAVCDFHNKGTMNSLHVVYKGAKMGDKVIFGRDTGFQFGFSDIYDGHDMSYGNFVGVFDSRDIYYDRWVLAVGNEVDFYTFTIAHNSPGTKQEVTGNKNLRSYVYPAMPDAHLTSNDPFILSVGVFGTLKSHHCVLSCMKGKPDGHCIYSSSKTFTKGGSDMLMMALRNDMETYCFEYSVFEFIERPSGGSYNRVIFKTSVVKNNMIDSFQKRVFFSNEVAGGLFLATNLRRCLGAYNMCTKDEKKSFTLTFLGYTMAQQVRKMVVHGGEITVVVEDKDCQEQSSQCIVTAELFAYRYTQMWIEDMKETHNGVIDPDDNYRAMIFQGLTVVIEPADKGD